MTLISISTFCHHVILTEVWGILHHKSTYCGNDESLPYTKYNVPAPRYTSYPTVPHWENDVHASNWAKLFIDAYKSFGPDEGISLYIHLPYCESLCTYCGCNKRITKNHNVELPYITAIMKEWDMYVDLLDENQTGRNSFRWWYSYLLFSFYSLGSNQSYHPKFNTDEWIWIQLWRAS